MVNLQGDVGAPAVDAAIRAYLARHAPHIEHATIIASGDQVEVYGYASAADLDADPDVDEDGAPTGELAIYRASLVLRAYSHRESVAVPASERQRRRRDRARETGKCQVCFTEPARPGKSTCQGCAA